MVRVLKGDQRARLLDSAAALDDHGKKIIDNKSENAREQRHVANTQRVLPDRWAMARDQVKSRKSRK
jgi:hypothetical protein